MKTAEEENRRMKDEVDDAKKQLRVKAAAAASSEENVKNISVQKVVFYLLCSCNFYTLLF